MSSTASSPRSLPSPLPSPPSIMPPSNQKTQTANLHPQDHVYAQSIANPDQFWLDQADSLKWHVKPTKAVVRGRSYSPDSFCLDHTDDVNQSAQIAGTTTTTKQDKTKHWPWSWSWFPDGELNTCENMVDRHVDAGRGDDLALIWDSPVDGGAKEKFTFSQLKAEVEALAGVIREDCSIKQGDVVLIYMPMIPAALFAMLASIRIGAIHAVVFGGFAPAALAQRIDSARPKVIMTASCSIEGSKGPIPYKSLVHEAIELATYKPPRTVVWQRTCLRWDPIDKSKGERNWQRMVKSAKNRGLKADCVPIKSTDGLYIIYTSGTTGAPKGVVREAGGHAVGLSLSAKQLYGMKAGDVMFCASDVGWVVGHSYILYAPLLVGCTTVLFEGKPIGTPDASTFWRIIEEYNVSVLSTAPTALRAISRADPDDRLLDRIGKRGGLRSLRAIFLAGERSEPRIVHQFQKHLEGYAAPGAMVVDSWWSSETGSPITGITLAPNAGINKADTVAPLPIRPGSAGKPLPGFDVRVVDDSGTELLTPGSMGNLVLAMPLAPTALTTLWRDPDRFYHSYLGRFRNGREMDDGDHWWIDTGDAGLIDEDGYVHVMSRSDDIINVAAHRFGSGALEQAVIGADPRIGECCVVGIPNELKGHLPFALVTLKQSVNLAKDEGADKYKEEIFANAQSAIRKQIGAIASLGGMIILDSRAGFAATSLPKTRSGKILRRVLRQLIENGVNGKFDGEVVVPSTIEDLDTVDVARDRVKEYFLTGKGRSMVTMKSRL